MFRIVFLLTIALLTSGFANQKIVLFNDTAAWYHWGCTGTSTALKEEIQKLKFEIQTFPINVTYSLKEVPQFEEFNNPEKFDRFCKENSDVANAIQASVAVVITGEGTIHDLRPGPRALLYLAHAAKTFFGKHVEIINHSAYPMDSPELSASFIGNFGVEKEEADSELAQAQAIYSKVYSKLDFIAIRELFSYNEMKKINISSTLSFDCLPLYIRNHYHTKKQVRNKTVVVAGSVAYSEPGVKQLCRYLETLDTAGFEIKVLVGAAAFPSNDDQTFVNVLKMHCKAPWTLMTASSMEEWLNTINHATFLVSGRFHHSIAAFCLNTPFIALNSNTHKVHAICAMLEQAEPLLYSDPQLFDHLVLRTNVILASPNIDNEIKIDEICELAQRNFDGLKTLSK